MKIAQIIDSLEIGGAERMAVNYANALHHRLGFSALVTTRKDGPLTRDIDSGVVFLSLNRKRSLEIRAVLKLREFCRKHRITHLQPHSSSFFTAVLVKITMPDIKIIWHDHNGLSEFLANDKFTALKWASHLFCGIIAVNTRLRVWAQRELHCKNVVYLPNFTSQQAIGPAGEVATHLNGLPGKRILCLANLRDQKDHLMLLRAAEIIKKDNPDWSFHLVGKDFDDDCSRNIKEFISQRRLQENVTLYGSRPDAAHIIEQVEICILTSKSEGLPVALIEYGMHRKAVVATSVGEISQIITDGENGFLCEVGNDTVFAQKLQALIDSPSLRQSFGGALREKIIHSYSEAAVLDKYLDFVQSACQ